MAREWEFAGTHGAVTARVWPTETPRYLAVLAHGYGEHLGRYQHVAETLVRHGATVCGPDHVGHGRSAGEPVLITDFADVVADLHTVVESARTDHPHLPIILIGHSMGGLIATRYAQLHREHLTALVLSGPVLGRWAALSALLAAPEIPDIPIDPETLSRDATVGKAYLDDPLVWHGPFKRTTLEAIDACMTSITETGDLGDLPTLWIHGSNDQLVPIEGTRTGIQAIRGTDFTEKTYPEARHEVFNETNKNEVLADVTTFIDRFV